MIPVMLCCGVMWCGERLLRYICRKGTLVNKFKYLMAKLRVTGSCMSMTTASSSLLTAKNENENRVTECVID